MTPFEPGEMVRVPLDTVILTLKEMMADDERVSDVLDDCIEPPNVSTIQRSYKVSFSLESCLALYTKGMRSHTPQKRSTEFV